MWILKLKGLTGFKKTQLVRGNQLAFYKHSQGFELKVTTKQIHLVVGV